jgi:hypothetical protein
MTSQQQTKQLLKILIGAAWIDGVIQTQERQYLKKMATAYNLAEDPELKVLLSELKPVQATECYQWLKEYCGDHPQEKHYQDLLEKLSGLLYSDGDIQIQEAKLLTTLQGLDPGQEAAKSPLEKLLGRVRRLYGAMDKI